MKGIYEPVRISIAGSAVEIVYLVTFYFAIANSIRGFFEVPHQEGLDSSLQTQSIALSVATVSSLLFLRMYYILHQIEKPLDHKSSKTDVNFAVKHLGWIATTLERLIRFVMFLTVINVAKPIIEIGAFIQYLRYVSFWLQTELTKLLETLASYLSYYFHSNLLIELVSSGSSAYSPVTAPDDQILIILASITLLAILFIVWDMIVIVVSSRRQPVQMVTRYLNLKEIRKNRIEQSYASLGIGKTLYLYLISPKLHERLFLLLTGILGISIYKSNNDGPFMSSLWMMSVGVYITYLFSTNSGTLIFLVYPLEIPVRYIGMPTLAAICTKFPILRIWFSQKWAASKFQPIAAWTRSLFDRCHKWLSDRSSDNFFHRIAFFLFSRLEAFLGSFFSIPKGNVASALECAENSAKGAGNPNR